MTELARSRLKQIEEARALAVAVLANYPAAVPGTAVGDSEDNTHSSSSNDEGDEESSIGEEEN